MSDAKQQLARALETALAQYAETMGEAFPILPALDVANDPDLWAVAEIDGDEFRIRVSTGTADCTASLWASAFADGEFRKSFGIATGADASTMSHISLVWLMLHEMHHFQMRHFGAPTARQPSQASVLKKHGLVTRTKKSASAHSSDATEISLIFEMRADHDATEMLLDAYSSDEWLDLRTRVAAISAMMMLIERADSSNQRLGITHPKAATRIFQLLGHVIDMPVIAAHLELNQGTDSQPRPDNLPTQAEQESFAAQIVIPAFFDAVSLANITSAQTITDDLGSATDFFHDVEAVKLDHSAAPNELVTVGAQQWADLVALNTQISW
ncbi:hypothetical protein MACH17_19880 [Phaeobacter inhibens]|nr:hypothetical protein MACH17_19880 [Phaeobacter inhibens]